MMVAVRPGLRPQILALVGILLGLTFGPLFWTASTFSRLSLERSERRSATAVAHAVGYRILAAPSSVESALQPPVVSIERRDPQGAVVGRVGAAPPAGLPDRLPAEGFLQASPPTERLWCDVADHRGQARVAVSLGSVAREVQTTVGLLGLYTGLLGTALLLATYFALTRLIVKPLDALGHAARRVAQGTGPFEVGVMPARELAFLGQSLSTMTERLKGEGVELRRRMEELERTTLHLAQAQERLVRSERLASVGRLAAGLAHELGNPIAALLGFEDLLLAGGLSPQEQSDFLCRMKRETERINRILRDLLDFARPSTGAHPDGSEEPGDVAQAIAETLQLMSPQKAWKKIHLDTRVGPSLPEVTLGRSQLVQILLNLLFNAADAVDVQGKVLIEAELESEGVRISVSDDGPGISPAVRDRLFEPFATTKDVGKGTGLGLAVCRGLVESAGGVIRLDDEYRSGARFVLWLPAAPVPGSSDSPPGLDAHRSSRAAPKA